jgi:predicted metal-dependent hydrolase
MGIDALKRLTSVFISPEQAFPATAFPGGPNLEVERKKGQRTLRMRVTPEGVRLSAPQRASNDEIIRFVEGHRPWIERHWSTMQAKQAALKAELERHRGEVLVLGGWKPVVALAVGGRKPVLAVMPEKAVLKTPDGRWSASQLERALKELATATLAQEVKQVSQRTGIRYTGVTVRSQKSRWGSCSTTGSINLNWRLIKCPGYVREYVIVHELAHIVEFNHSDRFWNLVHQLLPEYRKALEWIAANSRLVFAEETGPEGK